VAIPSASLASAPVHAAPAAVAAVAPVAAPAPTVEDEDDAPDPEPIRPRRTRQLHVMTTPDEDDLLEKMDRLESQINAKFDAFTITAPATMTPSDVISEVESLVAEIEEKERQLREQKQIIDEMTNTKENARLRTELDIAQTELQGMQSLRRGERDHRAEGDRLRGELRRLRERKLGEMEQNFGQLRTGVARQQDITREAAAKGAQETFYGFIAATIERVGARLAGQQGLTTREITDVVFDVFSQGSEELMKKVEESGFV
jgi:hypothetical protein